MDSDLDDDLCAVLFVCVVTDMLWFWFRPGRERGLGAG